MCIPAHYLRRETESENRIKSEIESTDNAFRSALMNRKRLMHSLIQMQFYGRVFNDCSIHTNILCNITLRDDSILSMLFCHFTFSLIHHVFFFKDVAFSTYRFEYLIRIKICIETWLLSPKAQYN